LKNKNTTIIFVEKKPRRNRVAKRKKEKKTQNKNSLSSNWLIGK